VLPLIRDGGRAMARPYNTCFDFAVVKNILHLFDEHFVWIA